MSRFVTFAVQSGSNGNCIYVEAGDTRLLFDAGVAARTVRQRMAEHQRTPEDCDALIISHDHSDHTRCAGVYQRKFGVPMYLTTATRRAIRTDLGALGELRYFQAGDVLTIGDVRVHTFRTPHDAADGVVFIVEHDGRRLGIFTDLGHVFKGLEELLAVVDAAYLESNYDVDMLLDGPYPYYLKERITGSGGHLSNVDSARLVRRTASKRQAWIALAHLSEHNNRPELALEEHHGHVGREFPFTVCSRSAVSPLLAL
ncbi:MAG TPA: MBL fold metallo-hydrolase [Phycisphaerae bacterium]|nr:MBL fold metallo-hydrolase [Phycisphaerales bacterium]HRX83513.1 MBL fold metallo-hydrolase [Phycisphaerae bacterium]